MGLVFFLLVVWCVSAKLPFREAGELSKNLATLTLRHAILDRRRSTAFSLMLEECFVHASSIA